MTRKAMSVAAAGALAVAGLLSGTAMSGQSSPPASAASLAGTVSAPGGAPFRGAFVRARATNRPKITITVLSDRTGRYVFDDLQPGAYDVWASATGYEMERRAKGTVARGKTASVDLPLRKVPVKWSDLNHYQAKELLPKGEGVGKDVLFSNTCFICHGIQKRIFARRMNEAGWTKVVNSMRASMRSRLAGMLNDAQSADLVKYLTATFGVDSPLPQSPEDMPGYAATVRPLDDESLKVVYVEYDLPYNRIPFSAYPDKDGSLWIPYYSSLNRIGRLNPTTGDVEEFNVPAGEATGIHSAVRGADGLVWIAAQLTHKLVSLDPATKKVTEYFDDGKRGQHTARVDPRGQVWVTGPPLSRFDPKTQTFRNYKDAPFAYDIDFDAAGNAWLALYSGGNIGVVDVKTDQLTKFEPPTRNSYPRRLRVDHEGIVWFTQYRAGKIGRFDPKTATFKEIDLPGPANPGPYGIGIDRDNYIWYNADYLDTLGRLDPKTNRIVEYPFPYSENMIKEFVLDAQGRLWWGSTGNDKVGYVYVRK